MTNRWNLEPFLPLVGVAALIALWYLTVRAGVIDPVLLPTPGTTALALWKGFDGGKLGHDFVITIQRTAIATVNSRTSPSIVKRIQKGMPPRMLALIHWRNA